MHTATVFIELGTVVLVLGLLGRLASRYGQSPIPLYLLGGLAFGHGGLLPLSSSEEFVATGAEIGVVLLLLMLGLEYTAADLVTNLKQQYPAGAVDFAFNALPGAAAGLLLGWGPVAAVVLAGVTWISSSGVIAKVLGDLGRLGNRETPVILKFVSHDDPEKLLLVVFGLTLLVAGIAQKLQVSAAVGAFLVGIALSGEAAEGAHTLLSPLRDLFAAVFFVFFGLSTDPTSIPPVLPSSPGWR